MTITDNFKWTDQTKMPGHTICLTCDKIVKEWMLKVPVGFFVCQQCTAAIATMYNLKADHVNMQNLKNDRIK